MRKKGLRLSSATVARAAQVSIAMGLASFPMCFDLYTCLWFNELAVTTDVLPAEVRPASAAATLRFLCRCCTNGPAEACVCGAGAGDVLRGRDVELGLDGAAVRPSPLYLPFPRPLPNCRLTLAKAVKPRRGSERRRSVC